MKKIKLIIVLLLINLYAKAQVLLYKTYEDFKNEISEDVGEYEGYTYMGDKVSFYFKKNNKKNKMTFKDIWGFSYKETLFRINKLENVPMCVIINNNKIVYYENGAAHLDMLRNNISSAEYLVGARSYLSKDINSELLVYRTYGYPSKKIIAKFKAEKPEYTPLFDCIKKPYTYGDLKNCVLEFGKSE